MTDLAVTPLFPRLGGTVSGASQRGIYSTLLDGLVALVLLGPVLGFLTPAEGYFNAGYSFALADNLSQGEFPITTLISRSIHVLILLLVLRNWRAYVAEARYGIMIFVQFFVFGLTFLWSEEPLTTLREGLHFTEFLILAVHLSCRYDVEGFVRLATRLCGFVMASSVVAALAFPHYGLSNLAGEYSSAWRGVVANKNSLGGVAVQSLVTSGFSFALGINKRWFSGSVLLVTVAILYFAHSATSDVAAVGVVSVALWVWATRRGWGGAAVFLGLSVGALILSAAFASVSTPSQLLGRSADLTGRTDVWRVTERLISGRELLGYGLGFWGFMTRDKYNTWQELGWAAPHAHNDILDVLLQAGVVGLLPYLYNWIMALWRGVVLTQRRDLAGTYFFMLFLGLFFRSFSEVVSVFPGINTIALIILAQLKLSKRLRLSSLEPGNPTSAQAPAAGILTPHS
jgi:O-antigen ligase